jgi:hypothetical protein
MPGNDGIARFARKCSPADVSRPKGELLEVSSFDHGLVNANGGDFKATNGLANGTRERRGKGGRRRLSARELWWFRQGGRQMMLSRRTNHVGANEGDANVVNEPEGKKEGENPEPPKHSNGCCPMDSVI